MRGCCQKIEPFSPGPLFLKQLYEFTLPKQSVLNLEKREVFLARHRLLIHNNPANEWADYRGEDEEAVISTWLEWNRLGGGERGKGGGAAGWRGGGRGWLWRYKSSLRNRAANTICHALSPRLLA